MSSAGVIIDLPTSFRFNDSEARNKLQQVCVCSWLCCHCVCVYCVYNVCIMCVCV